MLLSCHDTGADSVFVKRFDCVNPRLVLLVCSLVLGFTSFPLREVGSAGYVYRV